MKRYIKRFISHVGVDLVLLLIYGRCDFQHLLALGVCRDVLTNISWDKSNLIFISGKKPNLV